MCINSYNTHSYIQDPDKDYKNLFIAPNCMKLIDPVVYVFAFTYYICAHFYYIHIGTRVHFVIKIKVK